MCVGGGGGYDEDELKGGLRGRGVSVCVCGGGGGYDEDELKGGLRGRGVSVCEGGGGRGGATMKTS